MARALTGVALAGSLLFSGGCNLGDGGSSSSSGVAGNEEDKPDGSGTFFVDDNEGGGASRLQVVEVLWGRLVDVYALDATTMEPETTPRFQDLVIDETIVSNTLDYVLETNPATQRTRLIVQRVAGDDNVAMTFTDLVRLASENLPVLSEKNDDGTSVGPFSLVPRNACLVVRTNDLLDDDDQAVDDLSNNVKVLTSYPPQLPFEARVVFDPNHGGIANGDFHSSRVLVDLTISELEAGELGSLASPNLLGLPASLVTSGDPNVSIRIPTEQDFSIGQFTLLTNLRGAEMDVSVNGPAASNSTADVVRAFRSGNDQEPNNGFLFDRDRPQVVGGFSITVDTAAADPAGLAGFDFVVDLTYQTVCASAPLAGDLLEVGAGQFLEVVEDAGAPSGGTVTGVRVRNLFNTAISNLGQIIGGGIRRTPYDPFDLTIDPSCWVSFQPAVSDYPPVDVAPGAQVQIRFSEPMDPDSISAFETLQFFTSGGSANPAVETVPGEFSASSDLRTFSFSPALLYGHSGDSRAYDIEMTGGTDGVLDLAGNTIQSAIDPVTFQIDPTATPAESAAVTLRFNSLDEYQEGAAAGANDFRGNVFPDFSRGVIRPRDVQRASYVTDITGTLGTIPSGYSAVAFPQPINFAPLNPLGARLQTVWNYMDFGWLLTDETKLDLDVEGLSWVPNTGNLQADVFERFEIALGHSSRLPDISYTATCFGNILAAPLSGLLDAPNPFESNVLGGEDALEVVHNRGLGYVVDPTESFQAANGRLMVPYPLNRVGGALTTFRWRDTSVFGVGGPSSTGVPTTFETDPPPPMGAGFYVDPAGYQGPLPYSYASGSVPTIGLPLLMEFRCFPADNGLGLNPIFTANTIPAGSGIFSFNPFFKAHAEGGIDAQGNEITIDPDLTDMPTGGFNPNTIPVANQPSPSAESIYYPGQLDTVIALSRMQTVYLDAEFASPDYEAALVEPAAEDQPVGTGLLVEYRAASSFVGTGGREFDAGVFDPYGDPTADPGAGGTVTYFTGNPMFSASVNDFDGAPFLQIQVTFFNNLASGQVPELATLALPYGEL